MPKHDFSALGDCYPEILAAMPATFTSHEFICRLAQRHQKLYIEALYAYRDEPAPFQTVHRQIARHLHAHSARVELVRNDAPSTDIFGESNQCAQWRKLT